jgi:hypothetical protein
MTDDPAPRIPVRIAPAASINDNLPTGNPSGKTVLIVGGCAIALVAVLVAFHTAFGF